MKKELTIKSEHHKIPPDITRHSGRAIIIKDDKILLSHEVNTGIYMSPGGRVEENEQPIDACIREVEEETGFIVKAIADEFITVFEYCFETLFISHYFPCEIIGTGKASLTENEIAHGITAEWLSLKNATEIFSKYNEMREDFGCLYKREFSVLKKYLQENYFSD